MGWIYGCIRIIVYGKKNNCQKDTKICFKFVRRNILMVEVNQTRTIQFETLKNITIRYEPNLSLCQWHALTKAHLTCTISIKHILHTLLTLISRIQQSKLSFTTANITRSKLYFGAKVKFSVTTLWCTQKEKTKSCLLVRVSKIFIYYKIEFIYETKLVLVTILVNKWL